MQDDILRDIKNLENEILQTEDTCRIFEIKL